MSRDELISVYVSESEKKELQAEADAEGESLSSYLYKLMQAERERRGLEKAAVEASAEERIKALIAEGVERMEEIAEDTKDINARAGAYSVANFELLKENYPDSRRQEVLATGSRRLRIPLEDHADLDPEHAGGGGDDRDRDDGENGSDSDGSDLTDRVRGDRDE